ncbi:uncharacterized protein YdhG (YjbR/CyaY superfamily) [Actinomycetospora succinea]|uniref:Uncharacterized protein YdhG (YjbR/CyaY superfamily) n=1 Tax=Actinomycetospora succinea TaxID=663603 RepID=A0A4R6V9N0_9PSEU|nr:DUF1801 domain-containing protein [Actinomycetospora succinea]TDQ58506.1 uncharacterized protein YdhG (YjbR/CyaY superfamily) [Actinomycetospora succinea]
MTTAVATHEDVDAYIAAAAPGRQEALRAIRRDCLDLLPGFTEEIRHGMPTYVRDGEPELSFASQKQHLSLYVQREDVLDRHRDELAHLDVGRSCIRYRRVEQIDHDLVRTMLTETATPRQA